MYEPQIHTEIYIHICIHTYKRILTSPRGAPKTFGAPRGEVRMRLYVCIHICMYISVWIWVYVCIRLYVPMYIFVYIRTYTCTYVQVHVHNTHTLKRTHRCHIRTSLVSSQYVGVCICIQTRMWCMYMYTNTHVCIHNGSVCVITHANVKWHVCVCVCMCVCVYVCVCE